MTASEVLITDGSGELSQRVVECLGSAGVEARILSRNGRAGTLQGDLSTGEGFDLAVSATQTIIHCASSPFRESRQTNFEGTKRLLEAAAKSDVSHFVYSPFSASWGSNRCSVSQSLVA
jgi:nucleoside-diphosphate-sugar epimerase